MIVLPSGRRVTYRPLALALRAVPWIDAYRIVQERDRRLAVRILPAMAVDDSARGRLAAELESLLEEPMTIAVECGDHPDLHAEARSVFTSRVG